MSSLVFYDVAARKRLKIHPRDYTLVLKISQSKKRLTLMAVADHNGRQIWRIVTSGLNTRENRSLFKQKIEDHNYGFSSSPRKRSSSKSSRRSKRIVFDDEVEADGLYQRETKTDRVSKSGKKRTRVWKKEQCQENDSVRQCDKLTASRSVRKLSKKKRNQYMLNFNRNAYYHQFPREEKADGDSSSSSESDDTYMESGTFISSKPQQQQLRTSCYETQIPKTECSTIFELKTPPTLNGSYDDYDNLSGVRATIYKDKPKTEKSTFYELATPCLMQEQLQPEVQNMVVSSQPSQPSFNMNTISANTYENHNINNNSSSKSHNYQVSVYPTHSEIIRYDQPDEQSLLFQSSSLKHLNESPPISKVLTQSRGFS